MKRGHVPVRTCRGCGKKMPKHALERYILDRGRPVEGASAPGYGYYCCPEPVCRTKMQNKLRKHKKVRAYKERDGSN